MEYGLSKELKDRYDLLTNLINKTEEKINGWSDGKIRIRNYKNRNYFYQYNGDSQEKYISVKDVTVIERAIQREYLEQVYKAAKKEADIVGKFINAYPDEIPENVYASMPDNKRSYIKPIVSTDEQFVQQWQDRPYTPKSISKDVPVYVTLKGERVRSKSEMIIADRLFLNGIPYKYECPLMVAGNEIIHPDFTILRVSDRKILYYEHCGMVGEQDYAEEMVDRAVKYSLTGIYNGDRLFYTYECSGKPLDVRVLDNLINNCFR